MFFWVSHARSPKGGSQHSQFSGLLSIYVYTHCRRTTKFDMVTHMGRGLVFNGQLRPYHKLAGSRRSQYMGFLSIYMHTLCCRTTKFDVVSHVGGTYILVSATPPTRIQRCSMAPRFYGLCLHPLKQNNQIRRGNTMEGVLGQPHHCVCTNASRGLSATAEFLVNPQNSECT